MIDNSDNELTYVILRDINKTPYNAPTSFLADYRDKNRASVLIQELIYNGNLKISDGVILVTDKGKELKKELLKKRQENEKEAYISVFNKVLSDFANNSLDEHYKQIMLKSPCQKCAALIFADNINGKDGNVSWKKEICADFKQHEAAVKHEQDKARIEKELSEIKSSGIDKYEISAATSKPQKETCAKCKSMDGKIFPVGSAVIGVNCPPFHEGCRCDIMPVLPDEEDLDKEWDDFVEENVPDGMSFNEWLDHLEPTNDGRLSLRHNSRQRTNVQRRRNTKPEKNKPKINKVALIIGIVFFLWGIAAEWAPALIIGVVSTIIAFRKMIK